MIGTADTATLQNAENGSAARSERATQPWIAMGISARTYYRRKAATAADSGPEQCIAHVVDWLRWIGPFARLDYRREVRRAGREARWVA